MNDNSKGKRTGRRDYLIIGSIAVLIVVGYSLYRAGAASSEDPHANHQQVQTPAAMPPMNLNYPTDYDGLVNGGHQLMDAGHYAEAAESYRRALEINSESPDVRTDYGACLHALGMNDRALQEFQTVLQHNPDHSIARFNAGIVFHTMNQQDSARVYWEELLRTDPNSRMAATVRELLSTTNE